MHRLSILAAGCLFVAASANATTAVDPAGDFLASYTGTMAADLDIRSLSATFSSLGVYLSTTMDGAVGTTPGTFSIWGVNRGNGAPRLISSGPPSVGPPTILLDAIVRLGADGSGFLLAFPTMGAPVGTPLAPGSVIISGNTISAFVPFSLLPSTGFATNAYTYINWTRSDLGSQVNIADLAPDGRSITASVPEPASWAMMIAGIGLVGSVMRRRERPTAAGLPRARSN